MVSDGVLLCPKCGGQLRYYDRIRRMVRTKGGDIYWIKLRRLICNDCGTNHRELPNTLLPYKHYEARIVRGVVLGDISSYELDYEDYPCEMTMRRWRKQYKTQDFDE